MNEKSYFLKYQIDWLKDYAQVKFWEKSRRIGATYVQAYEDVRDIASEKTPAVWFSSADKSSAKEYILYCKKWAKLLNIAAQDLGEILIDDEKNIKTYSIEFPSGSRINALSSNPSGFRSKEGKIIIDEYAHHKNQEELWAAALPCILWGYDIRILSTHKGKKKFYKFIQSIKNRENKKWSLHTTTIHTAVEQGLAKKILKRKLKRNPTSQEELEWLQDQHDNCADERVWKQEFCCEAEDDESAFLDYEMIQRCEKEDTLYIPLVEIKNMEFTEEEIKLNKIPYEHTIGKTFFNTDLEKLLKPIDLITGDIITGDLYEGYDIARGKDEKHGHLACIWILEKIGNLRFTRGCIVMKNVAFTVQEAIFLKILHHPKAIRGCLDKTGMGEVQSENIIKKSLAFKPMSVEAVDTNNSGKHTLATNLHRTFQDLSIFIPKDDEVREDFHSVKKTTTAQGLPRFDAEANENGHADRFWACALANYAIQGAPPKDTDIKSSGKRKTPELIRGFTDFANRTIARLYGGR